MNTRQILHGIYGGLAGGLVFGMMMAMMGMLPMIGRMIGQPNAAAGFLLHMVNSAVIGAGFAIVVSRIKAGSGAGARNRAAALVHGLLYGAGGWLLGPLTLMPLLLGVTLTYVFDTVYLELTAQREERRLRRAWSMRVAPEVLRVIRIARTIHGEGQIGLAVG